MFQRYLSIVICRLIIKSCRLQNEMPMRLHYGHNLAVKFKVMSWPLSLRLSILISCLSLAACNKPSPEKCFGIAVLNSNMLVGFANGGIERELESPSIKMGKSKDEFFPMKRREVISSKIQFVEENYEKLRGFEQTEETKDIIQHSIALHEFILPVYKSEYAQLAKLYDEDARKEEIQKMVQAIHDKYHDKFEELYNKLISSGKNYAKANDIKVNWGM